jgi:hypothetical protein
MKRIIKYNLIFVAIASLLLTSCKKEVIPVLTTQDISNITASTASSGGNITDDGGAEVTARGVCWSTTEKPTLLNSHSLGSAGAGTFTSIISGLNGGTTYHVRAYATNSKGTGYGDDKSFITLGQAPVATTLAASNLLTTSATLNGTVNANYLTTTVTFDYGTTTSYGSTVTATPSPVAGNTASNVAASISSLSPGTIYHFRLKTVNALGTTNGSDLTFTTLGQQPSATTLAATSVLTASAVLNGTVNANYLSTAATFEYGLTTSYGSTIAALPSPVTGTTNTSISANLSALFPGTIYHFRVKAVNALGTTNGNDLTFTTGGQAPSATTIAATNVLALTATLNGTVNANELSTVVTFEYGLTTSYGSEATAIQSPVTGSVLTNVNADLSSLNPAAIYHFRIKAVNALGTTLGNDLSFTTSGSAPVARTKAATNILSNSATLNGTVNPFNLNTTVTFEYGLTTSYGSEATAIQSPVSGNTNVNVSIDISGLLPGTLYNFRVKAENILGVSYGNNITLVTN